MWLKISQHQNWRKETKNRKPPGKGIKPVMK
jgi:hypothetical protein